MGQPTSLGKYHILERLAADWVSEIFKVKTIGIAGFEKVQVLKRIAPNFSSDPRFFRTFIEEAKIAFSLNHRNIVQVFEFGKTGEDLFLAMEHIPGINLWSLLKTTRQQRTICPAGLACYLMGEVAAGLEYAHRKADHYGNSMGIVHCDLNPRNVACSFEGSVKILGFGLARTGWLMARVGSQYPGNPRYLSPEQVRGESLDSRSDIFSFGVMLWEMLTGMPLFEGTTREALLRQILHEPIPNPQSINPEVHPRLDDLTMQCLVRDVDQRFQEASDLQMALHQVQRQLGAVIGSRALSTYLDDLCPGHSEVADVRQESQPEAALPWAEDRDAPPPDYHYPGPEAGGGGFNAPGGAGPDGQWLDPSSYASVPGLDPVAYDGYEQPDAAPFDAQPAQDPLFDPPAEPVFPPNDAAQRGSAVEWRHAEAPDPPGLSNVEFSTAEPTIDPYAQSSGPMDPYTSSEDWGSESFDEEPVKAVITSDLRGNRALHDPFLPAGSIGGDVESMPRDPDTAGVLRSGRPPEDDPSEVFLLQKRQDWDGISDELTSPPEELHGDALMDDSMAEEISDDDVIEVELEDDPDDEPTYSAGGYDDDLAAGDYQPSEQPFNPESPPPDADYSELPADDQPTFLPLNGSHLDVDAIQRDNEPPAVQDPLEQDSVGDNRPTFLPLGDERPRLDPVRDSQPTFLPAGGDEPTSEKGPGEGRPAYVDEEDTSEATRDSRSFPPPITDGGALDPVRDSQPTAPRPLAEPEPEPEPDGVMENQPTFLPLGGAQPSLDPVRDSQPTFLPLDSGPPAEAQIKDSQPTLLPEREDEGSHPIAEDEVPTLRPGLHHVDDIPRDDPTLEPEPHDEPLATTPDDHGSVPLADPLASTVPEERRMPEPDDLAEVGGDDETFDASAPRPQDLAEAGTDGPTPVLAEEALSAEPAAEVSPQLAKTFREEPRSELLERLGAPEDDTGQAAELSPDAVKTPVVPSVIEADTPLVAVKPEPTSPEAARAPEPEHETATAEQPAVLQEPYLDAHTRDDELIRPAETHTGEVEQAPSQGLGEKKRFIAVSVILEGAPEVLIEAAAMVSDIAYKRDGTLHQQRDDALMVLFGLPAADEHDILAAAAFAQDSLEAVEHLQPARDGAGAVANVRVGIRAGTARMSAQPLRGGYQLLGNTVAETEAVSRHASPGQVILSGVAARLARAHFALREESPIKRRAKKVRCYRLIGPHRGRRGKAAATAPPVGREVEVRAIRTALQETVLRGVQRAAVIIGEAGIGKSCLVDHVLQAHCADFRMVAAAATPHTGSPNAVLVDLLRGVTNMWGVRDRTFRNQLRPALEDILDQEREAQAIDTLATLLIPPDAPAPEAGAGPGKRRRRRAMRALLNEVAAEKPLLLVVEDLHWADRASMDCISHMISHPEEATAPVLFMVTARPEEVVISHKMASARTTDLVLLDELDPDDRRRLIREDLGDDATPEIVDEVEGRAGGNPFYIRELTRAITELGASDPADIPPSVQRVIAGRVDHLPAQVKSVLQHAAVIGPTFHEVILSRLLSRNPARSLATLRNKGLIISGLQAVSPSRKRQQTPGGFERTWAFRNVMIQEVVYEAISAVARKTLHGKVGEIMARRARRGSNDAPMEVARHLELGGSPGAAGEFYLRAANEAAGCFASREALELYAKSLRLCEGRGPELLYAIHAGRERVYSQLGMHDEQAHELKALARLSGDDPVQLADLRNREALRLLRLGELYRALAAAEEAEALATDADDTLARGEALRLRGEAYERLNDHGRAMEAVTAALDLFSSHGAVQNQIRAHISLGRICLLQARYEEAFSQYEPALDLIKQSEDHWQERILRNCLGVVHYCMGNFPQALGEALYSLRLCEEFGDRAREGDNASVVGIVYLDLGMYDHARKHLETAVAIHQETGSQWSEADTLVYMGLLSASMGRFTSALRYLQRAHQIAARIGAKSIVVNTHNAVAWTLCERSQGDDAARAVDEAMEAADVAHNTRLIVGEIPGLSRAARATAQLGDAAAARALSRRAVELLGDQRYIEGPEEEVYYTHFRILATLEDPSAVEYLKTAHQWLISKMDRLDQPEWLRAYIKNVRLNVAILRDHRRLVEGK